jgi:hypothetical protein
VDAKPKEQGPWVRRLPILAIGAALLLTYHALVVWPDASDRSGFDAPFAQSWAAIALTTLFLFMSVINIATVLAFVLRAELRSSVGERLDLIAYAFSLVPAIYGVVVAMLTGRPILYLPFGAFAFSAIAAAYTSLRVSRSDRHPRRSGPDAAS